MVSILKGLLAPVLFVGLVVSSCSTDKTTSSDADQMDHAQHDMGGHSEAASKENQPAIDAVTGYVDPVCMMKISKDASHRFTYDNVTYGFCSEACKDMFAVAPQNYLAAIEE